MRLARDAEVAAAQAWRLARDAEVAAAQAWRLLHAEVAACRWCAVGDCPRHAPAGGGR